MPLALQAAVLVLAQTLILLVPWVPLRITYYSPQPDDNLDHARTARAARWFIGWPATVALVLVGAWWVEHDHSLLLVGYLALTTRVVIFFAGNARRSVPVLSWAFPWLLGPVLAYAAVLLADAYLWQQDSERGWFGWVVAVLLALFGPPQVVALLATVLRPVLVGARRLLSIRRLHGRWLRSGGNWVLCDVRRDENGAVLWFTGLGVILPLPSGERPHFGVRLTYDRDWQPPPGLRPPARLAEHPGPGPIEEAVFTADWHGRRAATARLDPELVVLVEEVGLGGDDFFAFITSLQPTGRPRT